MNKKLITKIITIGLVLILLGGAVITTYAAITKVDQVKVAVKKTGVTPKIESPKSITKDELALKVKREPKKEVDISDVNISDDFDKEVRDSDKTNSNKNINNLKKALKELEIPETYRDKIKALIKKGYRLPDILIAYNFLNEYYGKISQIEGLLEKNKNGKTWDVVFNEYTMNKGEFIPTNFDKSYIENLIKTDGISADDIMIADRMAFNGTKKFDELIDIKKTGKNWKDIKVENEIINMEEKLLHTAISGTEIKKITQSGELNEKEAIEALVIAQKMGKTDDEVIAKMKKHEKKEHIYAEYFNQKYK